MVVQTTPEEGFVMSADKLRAVLTPRSRLLILCTPSNPSGAVYTKCVRKGLQNHSSKGQNLSFVLPT